MFKPIKMIVACDLNGLIAYNGSIPWREPCDMKRFKNLTIGHSVITGRKTFESIPAPAWNWDNRQPAPLPNRDKYVISSSFVSEYTSKDVFVHSSLISAIQSAAESKKDIWIIGGEQIYKQALDEEIPDEIDQTILDYKWVGEIQEAGKEPEIKRLPCIPLVYEMIAEYRDIEANHLRHRIYRRNSGKLYLDQ